MDKFVIRNPRNLQSSKVNSSERKHLKQTTLQSLAGVVVLEELEHAKKVLESEEESVDRKLDVLNNLKNKKPSKEVLVKVGIGRTVRKLSKVILSVDIFLTYTINILPHRTLVPLVKQTLVRPNYEN